MQQPEAAGVSPSTTETNKKTSPFSKNSAKIKKAKSKFYKSTTQMPIIQQNKFIKYYIDIRIHLVYIKDTQGGATNADKQSGQTGNAR